MIHLIRHILSISLGILSWVIGMLVILPTLNDRTWRWQLGLSELSWLGVIPGIAALLLRRSGLGMVLGLLGVAFSLVPFLRLPAARRDMDAMICAGLGQDYETRVPQQAMARVTASRWWLPHLLGHHPPEASVLYDVPYHQTPSRILKLDVYRPKNPPAVGESYPAVIAVHGGSWRNGDKRAHFEAHHRYLASQGYVVFDIQYRLTGKDDVRWPTPLDDVCAAVAWVKSKAMMFDIDPEKIALLGRSAGGQIALEVAYRQQVKAVIAIYAPTDLRISGSKPSEAVVSLLGGTSYEVPKRYAEASPVERVHAAAPPTLLIHGGMDSLVSPIHAELLLNRLRECGVPAVLLRLPWSRHGFDALRMGLGGQLTQYYVDRFLAWSFYHD